MQETLITVAILVVIFLICRELMCWYWKINEMVSLLKSINEKLDGAQLRNDRASSNSTGSGNVKADTASKPEADGYWNKDGRWVENT